jgi:hypothetical protein
MVKLYPAHLIAGLTVYEDDVNPTVFYVMPDTPSFRQDPNTGNYVFKFIEYLMPVDRPDGSKGGGFLIFDSVFVLSDAKRKAIQSALDSMLQANGVKDAQGNPATAQISLPSFTKGTASLVLLDSGGALVTKIESAGKPSLLGSLICSFTAELSPEGAAVVKGAMTGQGGVVQIAYDLSYLAVLPDVTGHVFFDGTKYASFSQSIDKSGGSWDSGDNTENERMRELFINSSAGGVFFDFSGLDSSDPNAQKLETDLTNWGWQQLNTAVQNYLATSSSSSSQGGGSQGSQSSGDGSSGSGSSSGGVTGANTGADLGQDRSADGMEHVHRDESSLALFYFWENYTQKQSVMYETVQQGTLPNIPNFASYSQTINANDPFFAQIHATLLVNADFAKFQIQSVDVNAQYTKSNPPTVAGMHFTKPDDVLKFDSDTVNGDMTYSYNVSVNYQDQSAPYVSPTYTTKNPLVTVDVGTMGVLYVNITMGNVDFRAIPQVIVAITYPDTDPTGAAISRQFSFDANDKTAAMVVALLKPVDKKYQYQITYVMADGTQMVKDWQQDNTQQLFINSPFSPRTVSFLSEGDFTNEIDNIFLRMVYNDQANKYQQNSEYTFTNANRSHDWAFPVVSGSQGAITYSGVITYKDHTTENIPDTTSTSSLITFGPANQAIVTVTPDSTLIDFTKVKLVQLNFQYSDPANNISSQQEIVMKQSGATPPSWTFYAKDKTKLAYTYQATYYLTTTPPSVSKQPAVTSTDTDLVLMMPALSATGGS